jgi:hypothetical protein
LDSNLKEAYSASVLVLRITNLKGFMDRGEEEYTDGPTKEYFCRVKVF